METMRRFILIPLRQNNQVLKITFQDPNQMKFTGHESRNYKDNSK